MKVTPLKRLRGRQGIWVPGGELPPLVDLGYQRVPEDVEATNLMGQIAVQRPALRDQLQRIYHVPNGGKRKVTEAKRMKAQGTRAGVPDYVLPLPRDGYHGLYLELKPGDGDLMAHQRVELERLHADGYRAVCAWGALAAFAEMVRYVQS